jgi:hypothetical protein
VEEQAGVIEEDALDAKGVGVEPEHAEQKDCKDKACNCNADFPSSIITVETE